MIRIERPGRSPLEIESILIAFEGTLASGNHVDPKAKDRINLLSKRTKVHVLAKGSEKVAEEALKRVKAEILHVNEGEASQEKLNLLRKLGSAKSVVIGNGFDDALMMQEAGLSICVISKEGTSVEAMREAHVVVPTVLDALNFILNPLRQKATLSK